MVGVAPFQGGFLSWLCFFSQIVFSKQHKIFWFSDWGATKRWVKQITQMSAEES